MQVGRCWGAVGVDAGLVGEVKQLCYVGDVLDCKVGCRNRNKGHFGTAWRNWSQISAFC